MAIHELPGIWREYAAEGRTGDYPTAADDLEREILLTAAEGDDVEPGASLESLRDRVAARALAGGTVTVTMPVPGPESLR